MYFVKQWSQTHCSNGQIGNLKVTEGLHDNDFCYID